MALVGERSEKFAKHADGHKKNWQMQRRSVRDSSARSKIEGRT